MSRKRKHEIIELTWEQFMSYDLEKIGFDGHIWETWVDAVIVDSVAVFDRNNAITKTGRKTMNEWLSKRFGYSL
jgi:hypothetical protein